LVAVTCAKPGKAQPSQPSNISQQPYDTCRALELIYQWFSVII
jgi:hypothetical protein